MKLPTVLGRVVLVDGCTVFPSITALRDLEDLGERAGELATALEQVRAYEQAIFDLRAETVLEMRAEGWLWKRVARKFRVKSLAAAFQFVDSRKLSRDVDQDMAAA